MNYLINKHSIKIYHPQTKDELEELVNELIKELGLEANLNDIDTSYITDMSSLFTFSDFNGDISEWDVSNVIDMSDMFDGSSFNGDISKWDVSNVTSMRYMFFNSKFTGDISNWNIKNVKYKKNMYKMFANSPLKNNQPSWYKQ